MQTLPRGIAEIDPIEELRQRRWARENYVPVDMRDQRWHPVVLDEMRRRDDEVATATHEPHVHFVSAGL